MKNIHVLPTENPSRLWLTKLGNLTRCHDIKPIKEVLGNNVNIYITSDEGIKEGDWFYLDMSHSNALPDEIHQMGNDKWSKTGGIHFCEGNTLVNSCKKIILTTDQDLIKDGVQAIDDEFLEWFVKNPSCEEVEIFHQDIYSMGKWDRRYKIIIPKEEPKQEALEEKLDKIVSKEPSNFWKESDERFKNKETLEEVAEKYVDSFEYGIAHPRRVCKNAFINGAKWQQERSYSEEEVRELLETQRGNCYVALLSHTKNGYISSIALRSPEPGGKNGTWVKSI